MQSGPLRNRAELGVYFHFPYCLQKCSYCDFYSTALLTSSEQNVSSDAVPPEKLQSYIFALQRELTERQSDFNRFKRVNTIYFGGGTASLLPTKAIAEILKLLRNDFELSSDCEISVEGNPEHFTPDYLKELSKIGVNRVNVGLQSFNPEILRGLNRYYNRERYQRILDDLAESPITNIGVDLIYGHSGYPADEFLADLKRVVSYPLQHLSLYALTVEDDTPLRKQIERNLKPPPDDEVQSLIFAELPELTRRAGFCHYEISNFARPGHLCRHNLRYWLYEPYLGLGPGASGFNGDLRYSNPRNIEEWEGSPVGATKEKHQPLLDAPLNLLRFILPFELSIFTAIFAENYESSTAKRLESAVIKTVQQWESHGYGKLLSQEELSGEYIGGGNNESCGKLWQWSLSGSAHLDERIVELSSALEAITQL